MSRFSALRSYFLGLSACACLAGCGGAKTPEKPMGTISGKVTVAGKPLPAGDVNFFDAKTGSGGKTSVNEAGEFKTEEPMPAGDYAVFVTTPTPKSTEEGAKMAKLAVKIPPKAMAAETSELKVTVKEGENGPFTYDLK
jgi:hypothetical protein